MSKVLWVVGRVEPKSKWKWQLQGIWESKAKAEAQCKDEQWFIGPIVLNAAQPIEEQSWEGAYYPLAESA